MYIWTSALTFHCKGMFAVGWLELGEADKARLLLQKCFKNIQGPFQVSFWPAHPPKHNTSQLNARWMCDHLSSQVWSELADGSGAVNFLTGMGGFLQAVLFGYTGFRSVINPPTAQQKQWCKDPHTVFFFLLLEFRRSAWPFPHFSPMTFLSSAFAVWTIWAVRWTGCWEKMMFVLYWGNRQAALPMPMIYRLSWRRQDLKSLSRQVTHKQRHARIAFLFYSNKIYLRNEHETLYNNKEECSTWGHIWFGAQNVSGKNKKEYNYKDSS